MVKNILSYQPGTRFTGKECIDFFNTLYKKDERGKKIALRYLDHFQFKENHIYETYRGKMRESEPDTVMFRRVE